MGGVCSVHEKNDKRVRKLEKLKGKTTWKTRRRLELNKQDMRSWTGFVWLRTGISGGIL